MRIGIVDIGIGNVDSVARACIKLGFELELIGDVGQFASVGKIIFPGVGHYGEAAAKIAALGFRDELREQVLGKGKPILGICLGMQLLGDESEEGAGAGLGLVSANVTKMKVRAAGLALPHIGWNDVAHEGMDMFAGIPSGSAFYFVHSFCFPAEIPCSKTAICEYGHPFAAAIQFGNVWGTQFHPEKSQQAGLKLLKNFLS